ncbi:hypothetical protein [Streptomyces sp. NPDC046985]|uniref:hypothetical protein n=1 Tax=Streptomyces sp. NPDC046985 TaxID=3155377 RepID=UPI0033F4CE22
MSKRSPDPDPDPDPDPVQFPDPAADEPHQDVFSAEGAHAEPPLTSEPPLPDAEPLTSEPPLAEAAPLTSESAFSYDDDAFPEPGTTPADPDADPARAES